MVTSTSQSIIISNTATVKDSGDAVSALKYEHTALNVKEFRRSKITIAAGATELVDFAGIVPTYIKLIAKNNVDMTLTVLTDSVVLADTTTFEMSGTVPAISLENKDATNPVDVDFLIAE